MIEKGKKYIVEFQCGISDTFECVGVKRMLNGAISGYYLQRNGMIGEYSAGSIKSARET